MKKALALVLALVMVLSLAVSAFALNIVEVKPESAATKDDRIDVSKSIDLTEDGTVYLVGPEGGKAYLLIDTEGKNFTNVEVSATGNVTAEVKKYDPETMKGAGVNFYLAKDGEDYSTSWTAEQTAAYEKVVAEQFDGVAEPYGYKFTKAVAKAFNALDKVSGRYTAKADKTYYVVIATVAENYTAAYTEGVITVKAVDSKKVNYTGKYTIISDVNIFEYEEVKWAANEEGTLVVAENTGYSDYKTALNGYGEEYVVENLRDKVATVVSTTAFRAIEGKDLAVESAGITVEISKIAKGQKGVNFAAYNKGYVEKDNAYEFGFYGKQVIASDYTITLDTDMSYYDFRELFGRKLEEDDIVTFYVLKDGKKFDEFTVDFMTANYNDKVEIEINGKAGQTLGQYEITLAVPANEGEENPNTGAESMIGVVAALAVVSVATAAAVSLKK